MAHKAITISFANQKGGVGKTLTTSSVARILTKKGYKVLCVDMDPQRNLSMAAGKDIAIEPSDRKTLSILHVLEEECAVQDAIIKTPIGDLLRGSSYLTQWNSSLTITADAYKEVRDDSEALREFCDQRILNQGRKQATLHRRLRDVKNNYDFILVDANPSLTLVTLNCLYASDGIVIPVFCERTSVEAVTELIKTVRTIVRYNYDRNIKILGMLMTRCEMRTSAFKFYCKFYKEFAVEFRTKVFDTKIRKSARASDSLDAFSNLIDWDKNGPATQDYYKFTDELLREIEAVFGKGHIKNGIEEKN